jgi:hypothetical protein
MLGFSAKIAATAGSVLGLKKNRKTFAVEHYNHQTFCSGTNDSDRFDCLILILTFRLSAFNWKKNYAKKAPKNNQLFLVTTISDQIISVN